MLAVYARVSGYSEQFEAPTPAAVGLPQHLSACSPKRGGRPPPQLAAHLVAEPRRWDAFCYMPSF